MRITPSTGAFDARPDKGIAVTVANGLLLNVSVHSEGGAPVDGDLDATRHAWHTRWALQTATRYTVQASAVDGQGRTVMATSAFRTFVPSHTFRTTIFEGYHETYGVGMPIILTFDRPMTNRKAVERALEPSTSRPVVGAWYWDGDRTLYFRPRTYWKPGTTVSFTGHLDGVQGSPGVWGVHTLQQRFSIGRSLIVVASTSTHHARVFLDRKLYGDWPISSGKPGDDTPNGTYLTIDKHNPEHMVGPGYDIEVPWSVRFTWSGDFLHDAFWSVGQQGFENVSHGCVNLSPAHAEAYYKLAVPGDPVTITGSPKAGSWGNGWTVWFLSWDSLVRGSALHQAVQAGPDGSELVDPATVPSATGKSPLDRPNDGNAAAS